MNRKKQKYINVGTALLLIAVLIIAAVAAGKAPAKETNKNYKIYYELAKVKEILNENITYDDNSEHIARGSQSLVVEILTGKYKGDVMPVLNPIGPMQEKIAKEGTILTVKLETSHGVGGYQIHIITYNYLPLLLIMLFLFIAAVAVVGRWKGIMSLVGLAATLVSIIFIIIPLWLKGYKAMPLTFCVCIFVAALSFVLIGGVTRKTVSAMLGTALCLLVACAFAVICSGIAHISGMNMEEAEYLLDENRMLDGVTLNIRGLFVAGILISALGAVMDVAMSIASAVTEISEVNPKMRPVELFRSGMNIGRDMIGTMTNTLILAFAGTSLNVIIIMYIAGMKPYQLINNDAIMMEIIRALAGSIGLILAVPLTAAAASAKLGPATEPEPEIMRQARVYADPNKTQRISVNNTNRSNGGAGRTVSGKTGEPCQQPPKNKKGVKKIK